jgi:hypothetical protein
MIEWSQLVLVKNDVRKSKIAIIPLNLCLHACTAYVAILKLPRSLESLTILRNSQGEEQERRIDAVEACTGGDPVDTTSKPILRTFRGTFKRLSLDNIFLQDHNTQLSFLAIALVTICFDNSQGYNLVFIDNVAELL